MKRMTLKCLKLNLKTKIQPVPVYLPPPPLWAALGAGPLHCWTSPTPKQEIQTQII